VPALGLFGSVPEIWLLQAGTPTYQARTAFLPTRSRHLRDKVEVGAPVGEHGTLSLLSDQRFFFSLSVLNSAKQPRVLDPYQGK
jgi:hypothetical protein